MWEETRVPGVKPTQTRGQHTNSMQILSLAQGTPVPLCITLGILFIPNWNTFFLDPTSVYYRSAKIPRLLSIINRKLIPVALQFFLSIYFPHCGVEALGFNQGSPITNRSDRHSHSILPCDISCWHIKNLYEAACMTQAFPSMSSSFLIRSNTNTTID